MSGAAGSRQQCPPECSTICNAVSNTVKYTCPGTKMMMWQFLHEAHGCLSWNIGYLVLDHLKSITGPLLSPFQFAYTEQIGWWMMQFTPESSASLTSLHIDRKWSSCCSGEQAHLKLKTLDRWDDCGRCPTALSHPSRPSSLWELQSLRITSGSLTPTPSSRRIKFQCVIAIWGN